MNLLKYFLFLPIVFSAFNVNEREKNDEPKIQEKATNNMAAYAPSLGDELISADLQFDPYYKTDNFTTTFHYHGSIRPVKCWTEEDGVYVKLNDKFLIETNEVEAEIYCFKPQGHFTIYFKNELEEMSKLSVFTRLTDYGVFACVNSEAACENMVLNYEYENGIISKEKIDHYLSYGDENAPVWYPNPAKQGYTTVQGHVYYKDGEGKQLPAKGIYLEFSSAVSNIRNGYTDEDASFLWDIDNDFFTDSKCKIEVYAQSRYTNVSRVIKGGWIYHKTFCFPLRLGYENTVDIVIDYNDPFNKPIQIISCLHYAEKYVKTVGQCDPKEVCVVYPWGISGIINSASAFAHIGLNDGDFEAWDVILHEYGHTIEDLLDVFACIAAYHTYYVDYTGNLVRNYYSFKAGALRLAYQEALATVFGNIIGQTFSNELQNVKNVGDEYYDGSFDCDHNEFLNLEDIDHDPTYERVGDANEQTTQRFLYDLWDIGNNEDHDKIGLGNTSFWYLIKNSQAFTVSELVQYIYNTHIIDTEKLDELLEFYHFAPSEVRLTTSGSNKRISWTRSGNIKNVNTDANRLSKNIGNEYLIQFYSSNDTFLFEQTTSNDYYVITSSDWQTILNQTGTTYKVKIGSKSSLENYTTGWYFGKTYVYTKPLVGYESFEITSLDDCVFGNNIVNEKSFVSGNFVRKVIWQSVTRVTNTKNQEFLCLNAGASNNHQSSITFRTSSTFSSLTLDLVFRTNRSSLSNTTIEIYKINGSSSTKVTDINPYDVGMDVNNKTYTFTIPMGENAKGFKLKVTGYGYTALCVGNIFFKTN